MSVRWLSTAEHDLSALVAWYEENAPDYLSPVAQQIWDASQSLQAMPLRGRTGLVDGTRELLVPCLPYMLVYVVTGEDVAILRLVHQHQNWPTS